MENLQAELRLREIEEIRGELGSDYDSDGDRVDVTRPTKSSAKPRFQLETEQDAQMREILHAAANNELTLCSIVWRYTEICQCLVALLCRRSLGARAASCQATHPHIEDRDNIPSPANIRKSAVAPPIDIVRDDPHAYKRLTRNFEVDQASGFHHEKDSSSRKINRRHLNDGPTQKSNTAFDQASNPRAM